MGRPTARRHPRSRICRQRHRRWPAPRPAVGASAISTARLFPTASTLRRDLWRAVRAASSSVGGGRAARRRAPRPRLSRSRQRSGQPRSPARPVLRRPRGESARDRGPSRGRPRIRAPGRGTGEQQQPPAAPVTASVGRHARPRGVLRAGGAGRTVPPGGARQRRLLSGRRGAAASTAPPLPPPACSPRRLRASPSGRTADSGTGRHRRRRRRAPALRGARGRVAGLPAGVARQAPAPVSAVGTATPAGRARGASARRRPTAGGLSGWMPTPAGTARPARVSGRPRPGQGCGPR